MIHKLAYFYWNPSPYIVPWNIPILDRPILWYGFFFAFGFFIGIFILRYLLIHYLLLFPVIYDSDLTHWQQFVFFLEEQKKEAKQEGKGEIQARIARAILPKLKKKGGVKRCFIGALNTLLSMPVPFVDYKLSPRKERWLTFLKKENRERIRRRLSLEELFPAYFLSIGKKTYLFTESLTLYLIIGTVVGARLGDILFYQSWDRYLSHPWEVLYIWQGGLASHGGAVGILVGLYLFWKKVRKENLLFSFVNWLDLIVIPAALIAGMIRVGNFFNQEVLGAVTDVPWAVIFGGAADGSGLLPRHPVQLYEAAFYFFVFIALFFLWRFTSFFKKEGRCSGAFLLSVFTFRFFIEFIKVEHSLRTSLTGVLHMGQLLSIPLIFIGAALLFRREKSIGKLTDRVGKA